MSLIAELKRRKVFKVGAAYLVVAWLVVQVGATVAPQLGLPEWAPRLITLLVLLGFPVSLVVAWMVDVTPDGIRLETAPVGNKRFFGIAAVLAAVAVGWFLRGGMPGGGEAPATAEAPLGAQSTAVLPFVNMSADKDNEYFSDGLTETLLHKLAQVAELKVAARTSSFAFKGKNSDVRAIGAELGVATVVEGSVQRAGDTLRITAQLVRTADGSHIWSKSYDRKQADLFAIQDEIAGAVTEALVGALVPAAQAAIAKGGTADLAAYDAYVRGLQQRAMNSYEALDRAASLMQQAIDRDPDYVDALVGLVSVWDSMVWTGKLPSAVYFERSQPLLERIAALDPDNAMLAAYRAIAAREVAGVDEAIRQFEAAVARFPAHAELRGQYATFLIHDGRREDALLQVDQAIGQDPLNPDHQLSRGTILMILGRLDEAEVAFRRAAELNPTDPNPVISMSEIAWRRGNLAEAVAGALRTRRLDPQDHEIAASIANQLAEVGEVAAAEAWLAEARRLKPGNLVADANTVLMQFGRGELESVLAGALAIVPRHAEERRRDWGQAVSAGCLAAARLGRVAPLRAALVQARALPRSLDEQGLRELAQPRYPFAHVVGHFGGLAPCLFEPGDAGNAQRASLLAAVIAVMGPDWAEDRNFWFVDGMLRGDRARMVAAVLGPSKPPPQPIDSLQRVREMARWQGLLDEPGMVEFLQLADERKARGHAELPARLAAEGLSLTP